MNSESSQLNSKIADLIEDFQDQTIDSSRLAELRTLLDTCEEARQYFLSHNSLSNLISSSFLEDSAGGSPMFSLRPEDVGHKIQSRGNPHVRWISYSLVASLLLGIGLVTLQWQKFQPAGQVAQPQKETARTKEDQLQIQNQLALRPQASDSPVAVLLDSNQAQWKAVGLDEATGIPLRKGWLDLAGGTAVIRFNSGAVVTLIGPARFQLIDSFQGFLASGSVAANVPEQAKGFRVHTDAMQLTDLGTEFAIRVGDAGEAEVHVIDGLVEVECETEINKTETFAMRENDAKSFSSKLTPKELSIDNGFANKVVVSRPTQRIGYYTFGSVEEDGEWYTESAAISVGGTDALFEDFTFMGVAPGPAEWPKNLNRWSFKGWRENYRADELYVGFKVAAEVDKIVQLNKLCLQLFRAGGRENAGMAPQDGLVRISSDHFKTFQDFVLLDKETFVDEPKFIGVNLKSIEPANEYEFRFLFKGTSKARAIRLDEVTIDLDVAHNKSMEQ